MNWLTVLQIIMYVLGKVKDSDGDGRIDILDSDPGDPKVK